jgi:hypothetical protein
MKNYTNSRGALSPEFCRRCDAVRTVVTESAPLLPRTGPYRRAGASSNAERNLAQSNGRPCPCRHGTTALPRRRRLLAPRFKIDIFMIINIITHKGICFRCVVPFR